MIDPLTRIVNARNVEGVWTVLTREMESFGFDRLLYGFTRFLTPTGLGDRDDMVVLTTHSDDYIHGFLDGEMFRDAPMAAWAAENEGAKSWAYLAEIAPTLTKRQQEIVAFNRAHDVLAGYTISFHDSSARQKGAIALTARKDLTQQDVDRIWAQYGESINILIQVAHLKIISLPFPDDIRRLSSRQREVLEWVGDGKTIQDIATILSLNTATVEKHLRKAREALGVDTTAQAVMKASLKRQIFTANT